MKQKAPEGVNTVFTTNGEIDHSLLTGATHSVQQIERQSSTHHHLDSDAASDTDTTTMPTCGYIKKQNNGDEYYSVGWRFSEDKVFSRDRLFSLLQDIDAERIKAVMNTEDGVIGYNAVAGSLTEVELFGRGQSCIEIICVTVDDRWETRLLQCFMD